MTNQEILDSAPSGAKSIKIFDGFYRWLMDDNSHSKIYDCESFKGVVQIERSLKDIKQIVKLESFNMNELRGLPKDIDLLIHASKSLVQKVKSGGLISDRVVHLEKITTKVGEQYDSLFK